MIKQFLATISLLLYGIFSIAQDTQYSQFYAAPLYINPAFTGLTAQHRMVFNARDQWPGLPNAYYSTAFSYDRNYSEINSGFGLLAAGELAGEGGLWKLEIAPSYAYQILIDDRIMIRPGLKVGYVNLGIDQSKLVFNDEINSGNQTVEPFSLESRAYLDFSTGALVMTEVFWGGIAFNHINTPNQGLIKNGPGSELPMKFSLHGGAKIPLSMIQQGKPSDKSFSPVLQYKSQGRFDQLDLGFYYDQNPIVLGVWYRGIPLFKKYDKGFWNADAMTVLFGVKKEDNYSIGFSYDFTISRLGPLNSAGSLELSFVKEWAVKKKKRRRAFIVPCAKF